MWIMGICLIICIFTFIKGAITSIEKWSLRKEKPPGIGYPLQVLFDSMMIMSLTGLPISIIVYLILVSIIY